MMDLNHIALQPENVQRQMVIDEARKWLRTPYHHAADVRGVGVDCAMLLVRVLVDTGLCKPFDPRPYSKDWFMHRSEEIYLTHVRNIARQVETPGPGDIAVWKVGRTFSHGAFVVQWPNRIIHAVAQERTVVEGEIPGRLRRPDTKVQFWSYWAEDAA